jgi:hypothetical protein
LGRSYDVVVTTSISSSSRGPPRLRPTDCWEHWSQPFLSTMFQKGPTAYSVSSAKPALSPFKRPSTICCTSASKLLTTTSRDRRRLLSEPTNGLRMLSVVAVADTCQPTLSSKCQGMGRRTRVSIESMEEKAAYIQRLVASWQGCLAEHESRL